MYRYILNQFYVCTSGPGSVGIHSGLDLPKVWILAHDALHPQGGSFDWMLGPWPGFTIGPYPRILWTHPKQQSFDHSSVFHLAFQNPPGLYCFFGFGFISSQQISWKKWWGVGMIGRDRPMCWPAVQNFEVDFDCTRICEKTLNGQDPKCFLPPTALLSQGRFSLMW